MINTKGSNVSARTVFFFEENPDDCNNPYCLDIWAARRPNGLWRWYYNGTIVEGTAEELDKFLEEQKMRCTWFEDCEYDAIYLQIMGPYDHANSRNNKVAHCGLEVAPVGKLPKLPFGLFWYLETDFHRSRDFIIRK